MLTHVLHARGFAAASAALAMVAATPAWAAPTTAVEPPEPTSVVCTQTRGSVSCNAAGGSGGGIPLIVRVLPPADERDRASTAERIRLWEDYCRPTLRYDRYGVGRYVYRVAGCEFGRSRD
jgi:hypothetical protein